METKYVCYDILGKDMKTQRDKCALNAKPDWTREFNLGWVQNYFEVHFTLEMFSNFYIQGSISAQQRTA